MTSICMHVVGTEGHRGILRWNLPDATAVEAVVVGVVLGSGRGKFNSAHRLARAQ